MQLTPDEFRNIYNANSMELVGEAPLNSDITEAYKDYTALSEFAEGDGELMFKKGEDGKLTFDLKLPHPHTS